jgi:hypothetical protein
MKGILRPEPQVLGGDALVPERNLIDPAPNQFTHVIRSAQPYHYTEPEGDQPPDGTFEAGTRVVLLAHDGGRTCWVADGRGLYVATKWKGLAHL